MLLEHDVAWFLRSGGQTAESLRGALSSIGRPIESFRHVFELGCGCGRVLREWANVKGPEFSASDYNPPGVNWGRENIGFVTFRTNDLAPPLPFQDEAFDLCYAVSVFTHLPADLQRPWLEELDRVMEPTGILLLALSGESDLVRVTEKEQARFRNGELIVIDPEFAGTNMCGVYHPENYVRENWSELFEIVRFLPPRCERQPEAGSLCSNEAMTYSEQIHFSSHERRRTVSRAAAAKGLSCRLGSERLSRDHSASA